MKTLLVLVVFVAGMLAGMAWNGIGVQPNEASTVNRANMEYARELHRKWAEYREYWGDDSRLDRDWEAAYTSELDEKDGREPIGETPDVRARWDSGYYNNTKER